MATGNSSRRAHNFKDLTGQRFGRLTVVELSHFHIKPNGKRSAHWTCRCECGKITTPATNSLNMGHSQSCGCLATDRSRVKTITHGMARTNTYEIWIGMKKRCENPNCKKFAIYGGRGIKICRRWRESFQSFLEDVGQRPSGLSIDRINNDGPYSCGKCEECEKNGWATNCRWATVAEQASNRRNVHRVTLDGITDTHAGLARRKKIDRRQLSYRLSKGWSIENAILAGTLDIARAARKRIQKQSDPSTPLLESIGPSS